jgi:hypothetical protein
MKKYIAGGKAMTNCHSLLPGDFQSPGKAGGCGAGVKEDCSQVGKDFSAMLAARDRQMADLWTPPQTQPQLRQQNQIVVHKPVTQVQNNKQSDINTILDGDY